MTGHASRQPRDRLGHERPGAALHGPPISVRCGCGESRDLAYGEVWDCAECGRRWNTRQIPREQYQQIRRLQLRYRALPIAIGLIAAGIALFFYLTGNIFSMFILVPSVLMGWMTLLRPLHRRRYRQAIADLPRWELHPEQ